MNKAKIYRKAAEDLALNRSIEFSCNAISSVERELDPRDLIGSCRIPYARAFAKDETPMLHCDDAAEDWGHSGRVLALCFAAAMAETGDL